MSQFEYSFVIFCLAIGTCSATLPFFSQVGYLGLPHPLSAHVRNEVLQAQACPVAAASVLISDDLVRTLQARQLTTIRQVHLITQTSMAKLISSDPTLEPLALTLLSGLRFNSAQRGSSSLNHGLSIHSTGEAVMKFTCELVALSKQWEQAQLEFATNPELIALSPGFFARTFLRRQGVLRARILNQITEQTLARIIRDRVPLPLVAVHLLHGLRFGSNQLGHGLFNFGKTVKETGVDLVELASALSLMVDQWEVQVAEQNKLCYVDPAVVVAPEAVVIPAQTVVHVSKTSPTPAPVPVVASGVVTSAPTVAAVPVSASPAPVQQEVVVPTTVSPTIDLVDLINPRNMPDNGSSAIAAPAAKN